MGGRAADALSAQNRRASVDAAVAWWSAALGGREGIDPATVAPFSRTLADDLMERLGTTYRVYLEVSHQPKGILRTAALASGVNLDAFPVGTTMTVADAKVAVSKAAHEPYEDIHTA
jgi:hypothetical protein